MWTLVKKNVNKEQLLRPKNVQILQAGIENDVATPYNFTGPTKTLYERRRFNVGSYGIKKKTTTSLFH